MISYQEFKTVQEMVDFWALPPTTCERLIWDEELGDYVEVLGVCKGIPVYPLPITDRWLDKNTDEEEAHDYIVADNLRWLLDAEKAGLI